MEHALTTLDWNLLLAVLAIPLGAFVVQIFFGRRLPRGGDWLPTAGMFVVMCITVRMLFVALGAVGHGPFFHESVHEGGPVFEWLYQSAEKAPGLNLVAGLLYDGLGAAMLAAVGVVSFFVHLFSMGYMKGDRRRHIFFANISLFTFAMLGLVLSDNLLFLFIFWEVMGFMSYLLIGHFSHDPDSPRIKQAAAACKKAFLTTRVGDTCLLFGMAMFYLHFQTFQFSEMWRLAAEEVARNGGEYPAWMTVAGLFVFGGTMGKSAQFPLHIWLPDAMEGPTPVSAMIHAATMVAAGVFLLGRTFPLLSPEVLQVITVVGSVTALFAATIGCTVNDIKGVLAYSTISQLGFMVAAIGTAGAAVGTVGIGLVAGLFHMITHAFFKGCLFLSAGSVIHGCHHEQDMRKMGGLRKKMPLTFAAMLICTLAIAGTPLFSGFYSKDKILASAWEVVMGHGGWIGPFALVCLALAAMLTTFYMFRLIFMTFFGKPRDQHIYDHAHESPAPMVISLLALASLGLFGGKMWVLDGDVLGKQTWFESLVWHVDHETGEAEQFLYPGIDLTQMNVVSAAEARARDPVHTAHIGHDAHTRALIVSLGVLLLGVLGAALLYLWRKIDPARVTAKLGRVYTIVANKYYIDEMVNASVGRGTTALSRILTWIDENIVDGLVLLIGRIHKALGFACAWVDKHIVDGLVNLVASLTQVCGSVVRLFQTGRIQQYVSFAAAGGTLLAAFHILS
jgi:NADH-quinone oxidoreductase subunit L